jgi:hypothetical protein
MYIFMCVCIYTCIYTHRHKHIHIYPNYCRAKQSTRKHQSHKLRTVNPGSMYTSLCANILMNVCMYVCVYIYIHTYTHTYIHTYTHTHTHANVNTHSYRAKQSTRKHQSHKAKNCESRVNAQRCKHNHVI